MTSKGKFAIAAGGSALGHLLLLGGAVGWIAFSGIPENDDFSLRIKLGAQEDAQVDGSNFAASRESGEPLHAGADPQSGSVWWSWRALPETESALVEVELQGHEALVAVYQGFAVDRLELVGSASTGTLDFKPEPGVDYHIAVAGKGRDAEGVISLRVRAFTKEDSQLPDPQEPVLLLPDIQVEHKPPRDAARFARTEADASVTQAPHEITFESDHNTVAASELPAAEDGLENLPTIDGAEDLPALELVDREVADGELLEELAMPLPERVEVLAPALVAVELPEAPADEAGESEGDVVFNPTRAVAEVDVAKPEEAEKSAFQPHTKRKKVIGTIQNKGAAAVGAAETPRGRYYRQVVSAVEKRWHLKRAGKEHGNIKVRAIIRPSGKAEGLRILERAGGHVLTDHAFDSILTAEIPPIPEEVVKGLGGEPYEITFNFFN